VRSTHVSDAEQKAVGSVLLADDCLLAEHDRVGASLGLRQLGEDQSSHEALDEHARTRLDHEEDDGLGAAGSHHPEPVPDRVLRFYGEEQRRDEVVDVVDARFPVVLARGMQVVAMGNGDDVPDDAEDDPAEHEGESEHEQIVAPLHVDERREDVDQVLPVPFRDVSAKHVASAVLEHQPALLALGVESTPLGHLTRDFGDLKRRRGEVRGRR